jgi:putative hemolysin
VRHSTANTSIAFIISDFCAVVLCLPRLLLRVVTTMTIFHLVLAFVLFVSAFAQEQVAQQTQQTPAVLGNLDVSPCLVTLQLTWIIELSLSLCLCLSCPCCVVQVRVKIENQAFNVRFEPEKHSAKEMAQQLCTQRASLIGVTEETLGLCVDKVGTYLQTSVDRWIAEKVVNVPLTVENKTYELQFIPERSTAASIAQKFCVEQGPALGVVAESPESLNTCVQAVGQRVQRHVNDFFLEKTLQASVTIDGQTFQLSFLPERHSTVDVAQKLCLDTAATLKLDSEALLATCTEKVSEVLDQQVQAWIASKTLAVPLTLNAQPVTVSFLPERQSALSAARDLCVQRAAELELTQETVVAKCITPVTEYLRKQVEKWVDGKRVVVPVTVGEQVVNLSLFPERESSVAVARRFCVNNAAALKLTNENVVANCISPLNDIVAGAINKWAEARMAAQKSNNVLA